MMEKSGGGGGGEGVKLDKPRRQFRQTRFLAEGKAFKSYSDLLPVLRLSKRDPWIAVDRLQGGGLSFYLLCPEEVQDRSEQNCQSLDLRW